MLHFAQLKRFLLLTAWLGLAGPAQAAEYRAQVIHAPTENPSFRVLNPDAVAFPWRRWRKDTPELVLPGEANSPYLFRPFVIVEGRILIPGASVLIRGVKKIPLTSEPQPRFRIRVPLSGPEESVVLAVVGPRGDVQQETLVIRFPEFAGWLKEQYDPPPRRFALALGTGPTWLRYSELSSDGTLIRLDSLLTTLKGGFQFGLIPATLLVDWNAYVSLFSFFALGQSEQTRFFGTHFRLGYLFPSARSPVRGGIWLGYHYTSMLVQNQAFGFQNMTGPTLTAQLDWAINHRHKLSTYFKFAPIISGTSFLSLLDSQELAGGLNWAWTQLAWLSWVTAFDFSLIRIAVPEAAIEAQTYSLSFGARITL